MSWIMFFRSCIKRGLFTYTLNIPIGKKWGIVKSGDLDDQLTSLNHEMSCPGNLVHRVVVQFRPIWLVAPFYSNHALLFSIPSPCSTAGKKFWIRSKYRQDVTAIVRWFSSKKHEPSILIAVTPHDQFKEMKWLFLNFLRLFDRLVPVISLINVSLWIRCPVNQ